MNQQANERLMKELLDQTIREHILSESRNGPSEGVSGFRQNIKDEVEQSLKYANQQLSSETKIGVNGPTNDENAEDIENVVRDYIESRNDIYLSAGPTAMREGRSPDWANDYESVSNPGAGSFWKLWLAVGGDELHENGELYTWKLSTGQSSSDGPNASDYELIICTAYNLFSEKGDDNPLYVDGNLDTSKEAVQALGEEQVRPYIDKALEGNADQSDIETVLYGEALHVGMEIIKRNREFQNVGDRAVQYGAASISTSPEYLGGDATPKTDFYFSDGPKVSLKKKGKQAQYMSGEKRDAKAVFTAALHYFDENEDSAKRKLEEDLIGTVEENFTSKIEREGNETVTNIKEMGEDLYTDYRISELGDEMEREIDRAEGPIKYELANGDEVKLNESNYENYIETHVKNELQYYDIKNGDAKKSQIIKDKFISKSGFMRRIDQNFGSNEVDKLDEMSKSVLKKAIDHSEASRVVKENIQEKGETARSMAKWTLFEAMTGLYKFDGPTSSDPFSSLDSASKPVSDTLFKYEQSPNGTDDHHNITESFVESNADNINIRVSYKTRANKFSTTLRLEQEENIDDPFVQIVKEEREKMFEDIREHAEHRQQLYEIENSPEKALIVEDVLGYDFMEMINNMIKKGKNLLDYMYDRFMEYARNVLNRAKQLIRDAIDRGVEDLLSLLGMEIDTVEISPIQI